MSDTATIINLKITGMSCDNCAKTVKGALEGVKGVTEAKVDLDSGTAEVKVNGAAVDPKEMILAVKLAGYGAQVVD
jgi:copper chaperone CopZ